MRDNQKSTQEYRIPVTEMPDDVILHLWAELLVQLLLQDKQSGE
jgi:hypothetical protein